MRGCPLPVFAVSKLLRSRPTELVKRSNEMKSYLAIALAAVAIAGCDNNDEPKTATTVPLASAPEAMSIPATPPPPAPNAVDDGVERPAPGQANDHSSPQFDAGGKTDPRK
jgi:hypothetical protein